MIKIDIVTAISGMLSFSILFILISWIAFKDRKYNVLEDMGETYQCPYCTFVFKVFRNPEVVSCPRCKSYLNYEDLKDNDPNAKISQDKIGAK